MSRWALAAALLLAAPAARAQSFAQAKKGAADMPSAQGHAVAAPRVKIGVAASRAFTAKLLDTSRALISQEAPRIVQFVNDMGCVGAAGSRKPLTVEELNKTAAATAARTEVVFASADQFSRLTSERGAIAIGMIKELKPSFASELGLEIGRADRNSILLKGEPPTHGEQPPAEGVGAAVFAHELLHIVLRQLDNAHLGGGANKSDTGVRDMGKSGGGREVYFGEYSNNHHHLTDALNWKRVSWTQSTHAWTPRQPHLDCDAAFAAAQAETDADKKAYTPRQQ